MLQEFEKKVKTLFKKKKVKMNNSLKFISKSCARITYCAVKFWKNSKFHLPNMANFKIFLSAYFPANGVILLVSV